MTSSFDYVVHSHYYVAIRGDLVFRKLQLHSAERWAVRRIYAPFEVRFGVCVGVPCDIFVGGIVFDPHMPWCVCNVSTYAVSCVAISTRGELPVVSLQLVRLDIKTFMCN